MPSQTNFAKLLLYNNTTDAILKYGEFRASIAGIDSTSNMNKIDRILEQNDNSIKGIQAKDVEQDSSITSLDGRVSANEGDISVLKTKNSEQDSKISSLEENVNANRSDIDDNTQNINSLLGRMDTVDDNLSNLTSRISTNEGDILELQSSKATTATYTATISTTWTGENAPYTQSIAVSGIKTTDNPLVDILLNDSSEIAIKEQEEYAKVSRIQTSDGSILITCFEEKPEVEINIQLKVVR